MSSWEIFKPTSSSSQTKNTRDVFNPMMTPESIPQFTIPPLTIQDGNRVFPATKSTAWRSHQWHSYDEAEQSRRARRSSSDPICKQDRIPFCCSKDDLPDLATRAAMSLPHLAKITTPYGFVTLGESPHIANKESIFFETRKSMTKDALKDRFSSLQDIYHTDVKRKLDKITTMDQGSHAARYANLTQPPCNELMQTYFKDPFRPPTPRRSSMPATKVCFSQERNILSENEWRPPNFSQGNNSLSQIGTKKAPKNLFRTVLKKHFPNLKQSKSTTSDRLKTDGPQTSR